MAIHLLPGDPPPNHSIITEIFRNLLFLQHRISKTTALGNNQLHTDSMLFALIAEGDEKAFEQLFDRYLPIIQPVILQIVKVGTTAKDLVQDVFLLLWLNREKLSAVQEPRHYIFRIVYNRSFNYLKRQLVEEKAAAHLSGKQGAGIAPSLEQTLDLGEIRQLIETGIQALPEQSRLIYRLNRIKDHKPQEIADQLGISVQSVRNSLTRSGKFIREYLERQGVELPLFLIIFLLR